MKRLLLGCILLLCAIMSFAQGIPFLRNFTAEQYHAHNRNFDVEIGTNGIIYIANFEGVIFYDQVEWRSIHTPGYTRVTVVYCDEHDVVWVGGYNYFGYIQTKENGDLRLQRVGKPDVFRGEVQEIWESDGKVNFFVNDGNIYEIVDQDIRFKKQVSDSPLNIGLSDITLIEDLERDNKVVVASDVTHVEPLGNGLSAVVKKGRGIAIADNNGKELYTITEANGLCNDNVVYVEYDGNGQLWGATDDGIFTVAVPSVYSQFSPHEGITGEVLSIEEYGGKMYAGTTKGLFRLEGKKFVSVGDIRHACWYLSKSERGLLAATANGIYRILSDGSTRQLTTTNATTLLDAGSQFYTGELDGVYLVQASDNRRQKVCQLEKVMKMVRDREGTIWLQNLYGAVWRKLATDESFTPFKNAKTEEDVSTLVETADGVVVVSVGTTLPFSYPLFSAIDNTGTTWLTDNKGKSLYCWKDGKRQSDMDHLLTPFRNQTVSAFYRRDNEIWLGSNNSITVINTNQKDPALLDKPNLRFRSVRLGGDSILWGGFGDIPEGQLELGNHDRDLRFTYALDHTPLVGTTLYRYKLNNGNWSVWEEDKDVEFTNLTYGSYTLSVQAQLPTGELSEVKTIDFSIASPLYMRWYVNILYLLLFGGLVYTLFRYRLHRLSQEKQKLELTVQERTAEVVKQKNEIEEKSKSLEKALDDLNNAQHELIRQEKMATVGKLTQGLIDRILNPLNYINNFSKLSEGLVKDAEANVEDEKANMTKENYEDTMDVLNMLRGNLQKVGEHGQNTTRTLKAMEEMLKDRSGGIVPMDLVALLRQDEEMLNTYYANDIKEYGIKVKFDCPEGKLAINGNAEQLSKMFMSLLGNSVYAIVKKAQRKQQYAPEVALKTVVADGKVSVVIYDNGIGIEDTIIGKIFDPFFTTKTTSEAAGVGLYLSHEIVQNHEGTISVKSEKNVYTQFTVTLPTL